MNTQLKEYIEKWHRVISQYSVEKGFRTELEENKFFTGEYYSGSGKTALNPHSIPEPYLGDVDNCEYVCINLNPGGEIDSLQHPIQGKFVIEGNAVNDYSSFAKKFPYLTEKYGNTPQARGAGSKDIAGHVWWKKRHKYYKSILDIKGKSMKPFAIELCPWRSSSFGKLKYDNSFFISYVEKNIFDIASLVALNTNHKIVFCVGKDFVNLLNKPRLKERFTMLDEVSHENKQEFEFPQTMDRTTKAPRDTHRYFTVWRDEKYGIFYFNTWAPGSNNLPAKGFDLITSKLLDQLK